MASWAHCCVVKGIYHTQLSEWRAAIDRGLTSRKPGPLPSRDAKDVEIATLRDNGHP